MLRHLGVVLFASLIIVGCTKGEEDKSEPSEVESTVSRLRDKGIYLENYDEATWGHRVSADVLTVSGLGTMYGSYGSPAPTTGGVPAAGPQEPDAKPAVDQSGSASSAEPDTGEASASALTQDVEASDDTATSESGQKSPVIADEELVAVDSESVYQVPVAQYGYIAVRKCLRIETQLGDGLNAVGVYCMRVEPPQEQACLLPTELIRDQRVLTDVNRVTDENLTLGNVLTADLGFTYDTAERKWHRSSDGIVMTLSPLRVVALSFEAPCGGIDGGGGDAVGVDDGGVPGTDGGVDVESPVRRTDLSARTGSSRRIAVDGANRLIVTAGSPGTDSQYSMTVARYLPNQELDTTFGNGGYVELKQIAGVSEGFSAEWDEKRQRLYVAGGTNDGSYGGVIAALKEDGSVETSWGESGFVKLDSGYLARMAVDDLGRIYAFGQTYGGQGQVMRFGANGQPMAPLILPELSNYMGIDLRIKGSTLYMLLSTPGWDATYLATSDLNGGRFQMTKAPGPGNRMYPEKVVVGSDRVLVVGRYFPTQDQDGHFAAMFNRMGEVEAGFASGGILTSSEGSVASSGAFESAGTILISGWFGVRRYDMAGNLVKDFRNDTGHYFSGDDIVVTEDGSMVGASVFHGGGEIFRFDPGY